MSNALLDLIGYVDPGCENDAVAARLAGRRIYHAAPLHYLPSIAASERLVSAREGQASGILPRSSAKRRDRMLGVDEFVHLAFDLMTPLLCDKLAQGMPHIVLAFDAGRVYAGQMDGSCALLPCNTKAYRSRAACAPEHGVGEMAALLKARDQFGRHPSLEFLVRGALPLDALVEITAFGERDTALARALLHALKPDLATLVVERFASGYAEAAIDTTQEYCHACIAAGQALMPPPKIEFD